MPAATAPLPVSSRKLKRGETLLKPGDKPKSFFVVKSGLLAMLEPNDEKVSKVGEFKMGGSFGEEMVLMPTSKWNYIVLALKDSEVIEVPIQNVAPVVEKLHEPIRVLIKGLFERVKSSFNEVKNLQLGEDTSPCPADNTAKVFGVIFHVARIQGRTDGQSTSVNREELMKFATQVFDEDATRLEEALNILLKLQYARSIANDIEIMNMKQIEAFFDFYGNYHFKGGYAGFLKTNPKVQRIVDAFLEVANRHPMDRAGNCHLPYKETIDSLKKTLGANFEADQLFALEQKGLFIKRTTTQSGGILSFYKPDFDQMLLNWKILKEVELWNSKGYVDEKFAPPSAVES